MRLIVSLPVSLLAGLGLGLVCFRGSAPMPGSPVAGAKAEEVKTVEQSLTNEPAESTDGKTQRLIDVALEQGPEEKQHHEVYRAIQALTAEDFRQWMANPEAWKTLAEKLEAGEGYIVGLLAESLVIRWLEVDPDGAATWAPRALDLIPKTKLRRFFLETFAEKRPEVALAMLPWRKDPKGRAAMIAIALRELAEKNEAKARAWLESCTDPSDRVAAEKAFRLGTVEADPLRAVELAGAMTNRGEANEVLRAAATSATKRGPGLLRELVTTSMPGWMLAAVLDEFPEREPEITLELVKNMKGSEANLSYALERTFSTLAQRDRTEAISQLEGLAPKQRGTALAAIAGHWAWSDPVAAMNWLASQPTADRIDANRPTADRDTLTVTFGVWVQRDPRGAQAWAEALPDGEMRNTMQMQLASSLANRGDVGEATRIFAKFGEKVDTRAFSEVAQSWAVRDPQAASDWAIAQPSGALQTRALEAVVSGWSSSNPAGVKAWLEQFPPGETRDRCIEAFLFRNTTSWTGTAEESVAEFETWFAMMEDPWQRANAARASYWRRKELDPAAAREWLSSVPNVDREVIRHVLREP